ncbi:MAG: D-Ala-D-Ala carboxypeptidase family metallohydrolase [Candidatus Cloacimonas acidaminovorans]|nr:D-Ala-D-Ala carboxypeptidase family metallohydrolase [Candidatus Cloacimonas acidaminovorans]
MYVPIYYKWYELVPNKKYQNYWLILMDERILITLDEIRKYYGRPVTVNNWYWGGKFNSRGWREPFDPDGAELSQHKFGRAVDFTIAGISAETIRNDIRRGLFPLITCIEKDVSWVHIDVRNVKRLLEISGK